MTDSQSRVDCITWYHEFDFGNGVRARSSHENLGGVRGVWRFIEQQLERVPFRGASVLDVGAWDGYWSFFAERQGAHVVLATDDASQRWSDESGILLARELLGSQIVVREDIAVYELAMLGRTFDVILCLGLYYHLWDPLLALTQIRHCCHRDTIVIIEGELAWSGMTPYEARYFQSPWQECVLAAPLLERLLRLAYFRVDEQVWMHPTYEGAASSDELRIERSMLVCRPFEGNNPLYTYRPHFGLQQFDDRFRDDGGDVRCRAKLSLIDMPCAVAPGAEFHATVQVTNIAGVAWRPLKLLEPQAPILSGHSLRCRNVGLDVEQAFLTKHIVPTNYANQKPVEYYRRHIEDNWLQGSVTVGVQLWDSASQRLIDQDYSRGFLAGEVRPGSSVQVTVRMRAPITPGRYILRFDMVCEYVCWFANEGSVPLTVPVTIE